MRVTVRVTVRVRVTFRIGLGLEFGCMGESYVISPKIFCVRKIGIISLHLRLAFEVCI